MSEFINNLKQPGASILQEELAKTYFSTTPPDDNYTQSTENLRIRRHKTLWVKVIAAAFAAVIILPAAVFLMLNRVLIRVEINPASGSAQANKIAGSEIVYLNNNGEINRDIIKDIIFYEHTGVESGWGKGLITLVNESNSARASLGINFASPVDLDKNLVSFYAKGKDGGEKFYIVFKDSNNNLCNSKTVELQPEWQKFVINTENTLDFINPKGISSINFNLNPNENHFLSRPILYLKEICLIRNGG